MDEKMKKLLDLLGIEDRLLSETGKLSDVMVDEALGRWSFTMVFERPFPIVKYRGLIDRLKALPDTSLFLRSVDYSVRWAAYDDGDIVEYFSYTIEELSKQDKRISPIIEYGIDCDNSVLTLHVPPEAKTVVLYHDQIVKAMEQNGFTISIETVIDDKSKAISEQIEVENVKFIATTYAQVAGQGEKYESLFPDKVIEEKFTPIANIPTDQLELGEYKAKNANKVLFSIKGRVVSCEIRPGQTPQANIIVTDGTGSISCRKRLRAPDERVFADKIKEGMGIMLDGMAQYDEFYGEVTINIFNMAKSSDILPKDSRMDNAENKRVELHLHTKMSTLDGVNTIDEYVERAAKWNHPALGVSDHGSVQSFPELAKAAKAKGLKALFGLELTFANDETVTIIRGNPTGMLSDITYVIFDVESTGLSVVYDSLIEIAGVKIKNGQILDQFSKFIDPKRPISAFTTKLTGITKEMLFGADDDTTVLTEFYEFSKDAVLVAHNADFDLGFLYELYRKHQISLATQPSIDTMILAKSLYFDQKRFSLDALCKMLKVPLNGHHRAINDARATAEIFLHMLKEVRKQGITRISDLNLLLNAELIYKYPYPKHINLLVKTQEGLKNLYKILSAASTDYFEREPRIPKSYLDKHREGILFGSGCRNSDFFEIAQTKNHETLKNAAKYYDYLELQPISSFAYMASEMFDWAERYQDIFRRVVAIGKELDIPVVATGDVHHLDQADLAYREIMIQTPLVGGGGYHRLYGTSTKPSQHFLTTEEMLAEFAFLGEETAREIVITNSRKIADSVKDIAVFPSELYTPQDDFLATIGVPSIKVKLESMVRARAHKMYGQPLPPLVSRRLEKELKSIIEHSFSTIYYISHLLVKKSLEDGYLVGSRGSVGSSLVATFMNITEVNPLPPHYVCPHCQFTAFKKTDAEKVSDGVNEFEKEHERLLDSIDSGWDLPNLNCPSCGRPLHKDGHDIPFETFLGFKGDKVPDIDLNFSGDYQGEVHKYIRKLFGENYAFRAGTIGTCAAKTAYAMVKDYYKKINEERDANGLPRIMIRRAEMERLGKGIEGSKRTSGQHPGGIVVVPNNREIFDVTPIQYPGDSTDTSWKTTHYDYHSFESNLFKLDVLGHDDPTMIRFLMDLVHKEPLEFPFSEASEIPVDDQQVYRLLCGTDVINVSPQDIRSDIASYGVPEFGTNFVRGMLRESRPQTFAELVKISGLSHGTNVWNGNAQDLILGKNRTFGRIEFKDIIGCRDDIMVDLIDMGVPPTLSFEIMEFVRKGKAPDNPEKWEKYADEMRKHKVPEWYIWSCSKIKYMFPKAHATAYVLMAMRIAWFKLYRPIYFYAAYFSKRAGIFDVEAFTNGTLGIRTRLDKIAELGNDATDRDQNLETVLELALEMHARGFKFLPIDINRSDANDFLISADKKALLMPFVVIDSLGQTAAMSIVEARKEKPFVSKQDVKNRTRVSTTLFARLDEFGAFGEMVDENQLSLFDM